MEAMRGSSPLGPLVRMGDYALTSCRWISRKTTRRKGTGSDVRSMLGLPPDATTRQVEDAAREEIMTSHPDRGGTPEAFMRAMRIWERRKEPPSAARDQAPSIRVCGDVGVRVPVIVKCAWDCLSPDELNLAMLWQATCADALWSARLSIDVFCGVSHDLRPFWLQDGCMMLSTRMSPDERYARALIALMV